MKTCTVCKKRKRNSAFGPSGKYLKSRCKKCLSSIQAIYYAKNKTKWKVWMAPRKAKIKAWFYEFKATLRCPCGEDHPACIDFHHRNPEEKAHNINQMWRVGYGIEAIKKEIEKCDILCANCHRKKHWKGGRVQTVDRVFRN